MVGLIFGSLFLYVHLAGKKLADPSKPLYMTTHLVNSMVRAHTVEGVTPCSIYGFIYCSGLCFSLV